MEPQVLLEYLQQVVLLVQLDLLEQLVHQEYLTPQVLQVLQVLLVDLVLLVLLVFHQHQEPLEHQVLQV